MKAFRGICGFRRGSSLKTWLYRIAIREALNQKRWFKRHRAHETSIDVPPEDGQAPLQLEHLGATPFDQLATQEIQTAVRGALQQVAEIFRSAVILRDLEGLSYEEVAEVLDCSVGTVKSRILRGRRALKELLEPHLAESEPPRRRESTVIGPDTRPAYSLAFSRLRPATVSSSSNTPRRSAGEGIL